MLFVPQKRKNMPWITSINPTTLQNLFVEFQAKREKRNNYQNHTKKTKEKKKNYMLVNLDEFGGDLL